MKSKTTILTVGLLMSITMNLHAQTDSTIVDSATIAPNSVVENMRLETQVNVVKQKPPFNIIKGNLPALLFKSYSLQYERVLSRKISVAIQYRTMPETGIPFKSSVLKLLSDDDANTKKIIEDFRMSNYAITPEVRIYLSRKGYGRGFYFAPFYRYASFTSNDLNVFYTDDNDVEQSIKMSGKLTSNTFGFTIGAQNSLGKHFVLDWSLFGPHFGSAKGTFSGVSSKLLSQDEQNDLRQQLEDIDIPFTDKTVDVNTNGASLKLDGPWAGLRFTIALGFRF
ncbi:MAG: hypothetical protein ABI237_13875 [Ginsengibacter sp.]